MSAARRRPQFIFVAACALVVVAVLLNVMLRAGQVPAVMRYIPPESTSYVFSASLRDVWNASEPHFGRYFRAERAPKAKKETAQPLITEFALSIKQSINESGLELSGPEGLAPLGIDPGGAAAAALVGDADGRSVLLVVPIADEDKFLETAVKLIGEKALDFGAGLPPPRVRVRKLGDWFLAFPDASTAVLASAYATLARALDGGEANLSFFRSSDQAVRSFNELLASRPKGWLKGSVDLGRALQPVRFALGFDEQRMLVAASLSRAAPQSRALMQALAPAQASLASFRGAMGGSSLTALFDDPALPQYIALIEQVAGDGARALAEKQFPALWGAITEARTVRRIDIAVASDVAGVPDVVLGVQVGESEAEQLVFSAQSRVRLRRDQQILQAALKARTEKVGAEAAGVASPALLVEEGFLSQQRGPLWLRYRAAGGQFNPVPVLTRADFSNADYARSIEGHALRYILPPVTEDDVRYRLTDAEGKDAAVGELKRDRFRLCSVYLQGTLWFGNDADTLERWLQRRSAPAASAEFDDAIRVVGSSARSKAVVFVQPRYLLNQALLHPDPQVKNAGTSYLSDFSHYRTVLLTVSTGNSNELNLRAHFLRY